MQEELKRELADLEQDELNERLAGADHVPVHHPAGPSRVQESAYNCHVCGTVTDTRDMSTGRQIEEEDDEDVQLRELQAALAM